MRHAHFNLTILYNFYIMITWKTKTWKSNGIADAELGISCYVMFRNVWKGCRWTNKSSLVTMEPSIWSYL